MPNLIGSLRKDGTLTGILSSPSTITGYLSNVTLRGIPVELRVDGTMIQWKYEDETEWRDLIDVQNIDYTLLGNLPQIEGVTLVGNKTFADLGLEALTAAEIEAALT